ncbi:SDR family oxidoreductase [Leucobacter allii]|uniref:SDR family oxidoreductase n=1 Tax=Leucobacter allii TaxID=2932247 RepID=UPI001FD3B21E|nr:SDR family oxidoreductase [Leucobacter allii]UOR01336.1 SDR family oxidoreductase [Leucobacter allii]
MNATQTPRRALVVGASGISGQAVCRELGRQGWEVHGLSRSGFAADGAAAVRADLLDPASLAPIAGIRPEAVFITTWMRMDTEAENIRVNRAAMEHLMAAIEPAASVRHVSLMTGLKHYLGPFEAYAQGASADTPFHEDEPRIEIPNFYYAQEDVLFAAAERQGFTWSSHRSHTVIGFATGNAMNMALTLAVYAELCLATGEPFVFPGSEVQWNGVTDVTDVELLAEQMVWAAGTPAAANTAFNISNGDVFRWRWMWKQIAEHFGVPWEGHNGADRPLEPRVHELEGAWAGIVAEHGLVEPDLTRLASWWHSDSDLGRPLECFADMRRSRERGFDRTRVSVDSFLRAFERYREAGVLPRR